VILEPAGSSFKLSQPGTPATAESTTAHVSYQPPRMGAYPYAIGGWGYHYPTFPSATAPSSVTPGVNQADSVTNIMASGTFPYPYTAVQFSTAQSAYVPPSKYPYGAPALAAASTPAAGSTTNACTAQAPERTYNGIQWERPHTAPCDPAFAAEPQAQNESTPSPSVDADELKQGSARVDSVESSTTNDSNNAAPPTDDPVPTSSTTSMTV
jgi:hypothetical protein